MINWYKIAKSQPDQPTPELGIKAIQLVDQNKSYNTESRYYKYKVVLTDNQELFCIIYARDHGGWKGPDPDILIGVTKYPDNYFSKKRWPDLILENFSQVPNVLQKLVKLWGSKQIQKMSQPEQK